MSDITKVCNNLNAFCSSADCNDGIEFGFPKKIMLGKQAITAVGDTPTPAEVQTFIDAGHGVIFDVTNGVKLPSEVTTKTGADTYSNVDEVTQEMEGISFKIKKITNAVALAIKKNNLNFGTMRLFWVDSNNRWHGGVTGFTVPNYIKAWEHAGFGENAEIPVEFKWITDMYSYTEVSDVNTDYADLACVEGTYTETVVTSYVAGQVTGYAGITGWDKTTYPTLYLDINSNIIKMYSSASDRTSGTNELASVNTATSLDVIEANSSGFGGSLTFVSNAITDGAEWNVTYSA